MTFWNWLADAFAIDQQVLPAAEVVTCLAGPSFQGLRETGGAGRACRGGLSRENGPGAGGCCSPKHARARPTSSCSVYKRARSLWAQVCGVHPRLSGTQDQPIHVLVLQNLGQVPSLWVRTQESRCLSQGARLNNGRDHRDTGPGLSRSLRRCQGRRRALRRTCCHLGQRGRPTELFKALPSGCQSGPPTEALPIPWAAARQVGPRAAKRPGWCGGALSPSSPGTSFSQGPTEAPSLLRSLRRPPPLQLVERQILGPSCVLQQDNASRPSPEVSGSTWRGGRWAGTSSQPGGRAGQGRAEEGGPGHKFWRRGEDGGGGVECFVGPCGGSESLA